MGYSLSYARTIELEARLLEKEWTGEPGLFAHEDEAALNGLEGGIVWPGVGGSNSWARGAGSMSNSKWWAGVCYDVRDPAHDCRPCRQDSLQGTGQRMQYSVFRCWIRQELRRSAFGEC